MNADKYAEIIHSRIIHVQNLQSAISGLVITGCGMLLFQFDQTKIQLIENSVVIFCVYGLLIWMHLFTVYQYYSVKKGVLVLQRLESQMKDYEGLQYFDMGNTRLYLYFLSHGAPSIIALSSPIVAFALGVIRLQIAMQLLSLFLVLTVLIVWLLSVGFRLRKS